MTAMIAILVGFILAQPLPASPQTASTPDLHVESSISTAGPYGELWILRLTPNGDVFLRVYYSTNPSGTLMADFDLTDEYLTRLRTAIHDERFFDLPAELSPASAPLHQPDLKLEITVGDRKHKVELYDPDQIKGDPRVKRFLAVWGRLYEGLPLKPSW